MSGGTQASSDTLLRLVRYAAAACDARFAFVLAPVPHGSRALTLWMARDFGLHTDRRGLDLLPDESPPATPAECLVALRRAWPDDAEITGLTVAASCLVLPLADEQGSVIGHLGILDDGPACFLGRDRLTPLGRLAAAELVKVAG